MDSYKIIALPGDGIGVEVMQAAISVLDEIGKLYKINFSIETELIGGASIDKFGIPLTDEVIDKCKKSDSVLLGAVGGKKWDSLPQEIKPEKGLLKIRKELDLFCNIRPAKIFSALIYSSPLKNKIVAGADLLIVRELTSGLYFGQPRGRNENEAWNTMRYTREEIQRVCISAFEIARKRKKHLTSVHKANVLESSQFWREIISDLHKNYSDVILDEMYVDNAAMQIIQNPNQFDVIVTENLFGDILSDVAAMITGSLGMLPSASIGKKYSLYEPVHGSAPDIAGKNIANPIAIISSIAMMFEISFDKIYISKNIFSSIENVLNLGFRTNDISNENSIVLSTSEMAEKIIEQIKLNFKNYGQ